MKNENIVKASQTAALLVSDLQEAIGTAAANRDVSTVLLLKTLLPQAIENKKILYELEIVEENA